jgi:protein arginine N-methyltransferase 1
LIGRQDRLWVAVVEAPRLYSRLVDPWERDRLGMDLSIARRMIVNEVHQARLTPDSLLTSPFLWATLDYASIEDPDIQGRLTWTAKRDGTGHGIVIWFDADLADGVGFSSCPGSAETVYGHSFLPWQNPVPLLAGQTITIDLQAKLLQKDYFWRWETRIESATRPGEIAIQFDQSLLKGAVLSPLQLRKSASNYIPQLSEESLVRRRVLELVDGKASLEEIARRLTAEFPERFARWEQALTFAASVSRDNSG